MAGNRARYFSIWALPIILSLCGSSSRAGTSPDDRSRMVMKDGFSFVYHKCFGLSGDADEGAISHIAISDEVNIVASGNCPKAEQGTWEMGIGYNYPESETLEEFLREKKEMPMLHPGADVVVYDTKIKVGGWPAIEFLKMKKESYPLIDRKDQGNYVWQVVVSCGKKNILLGYSDHLDKDAREKARKTHQVPALFQELIDGFRCS